MFNYYLQNTGEVDDCGDNNRTIGGSPRPLEGPDHNNGETIDFYDYFLQEVNYDRCMEIYLPLGFNGNIETIISSAHPLNGSSLTEAFEHLGSTNCVKEMELSSANIICKENVIVVRPGSCVNGSYPFNFEDFLSRPFQNEICR